MTTEQPTLSVLPSATFALLEDLDPAWAQVRQPGVRLWASRRTFAQIAADKGKSACSTQKDTVPRATQRARFAAAGELC